MPGKVDSKWPIVESMPSIDGPWPMRIQSSFFCGQAPRPLFVQSDATIVVLSMSVNFRYHKQSWVQNSEMNGGELIWHMPDQRIDSKSRRTFMIPRRSQFFPNYRKWHETWSLTMQPTFKILSLSLPTLRLEMQQKAWIERVVLDTTQ